MWQFRPNADFILSAHLSLPTHRRLSVGDLHRGPPVEALSSQLSDLVQAAEEQCERRESPKAFDSSPSHSESPHMCLVGVSSLKGKGGTNGRRDWLRTIVLSISAFFDASPLRVDDWRLSPSSQHSDNVPAVEEHYERS